MGKPVCGLLKTWHNVKTCEKLDCQSPFFPFFQVVRMLIAIVVTYVICWGPLLIFNVLQAFGYIGDFLLGFEKHTKTAISLMAYFNR